MIIELGHPHDRASRALVGVSGDIARRSRPAPQRMEALHDTLSEAALPARHRSCARTGPKTLAALVAICAFAFGATTATASDDGETIYSNRSVQGHDNPQGHIDVVKREMAADGAHPRPDSTMFRAGRPTTAPADSRPLDDGDRVFEYSFMMRSPDGTKSQVLGTKRVTIHRDEVERMVFTIFYVAETEDRIIVLYKCRTGSYVDVAVLGERNSGFLMSDYPPLAVDPEDGHAVVINLAIDGLSQHGVGVEVTRYDSKKPIIERFGLSSRGGRFSWERVLGKAG